MRKERKNYTPEEKVAILRRHLIDKVPVSTLCEELQLQPTLFYHWLKQFFDNGPAAFQRPRDSSQKHDQRRIVGLEQKLRTKDEVLVELMEEHASACDESKTPPKLCGAPARAVLARPGLIVALPGTSPDKSGQILRA